MPTPTTYIDPVTGALRTLTVTDTGQYKGTLVAISGNNRISDLIGTDKKTAREVKIQSILGSTAGLYVGNPDPNGLGFYERFESMLVGSAVAGQGGWVEQANLGGLAANRSILVRSGGLVTRGNSAWVSLAAVSTDIYVTRQLSRVILGTEAFTYRWQFYVTNTLSTLQAAFCYPTLTVGAAPDFAADTWPFLIGINGNGQVVHEDNTHAFPNVLGVVAVPSLVTVQAYVTAAGALHISINNGAITHSDNVIAASPTWDAITFGASTAAGDTPFTNGGGWDNISVGVGDLKTTGFFIPASSGETFRAPYNLDKLAVATQDTTTNVAAEILASGV